MVSRGDAGTVALPGLVDIHCHGGGGAAFDADTLTECRDAARWHHANGSTRLLASLVSAPAESLRRAVTNLSELTAEGEIDGIHLEGPFLAPTRRGAHDPAVLQPPNLELLDELFAIAGTTIRMVTIAPELPDALAAIDWCRHRGIIAAVGHTDATADETRAALDAGATVATHLCNAMRPIHHRDPGPIPVLLTDERVTSEIITDGHHLAPEIAELIWAAAQPDRVVGVSDCIAAAGADDGQFTLGTLQISVADGTATVAGTDTIAGSTATLADCVANARSWNWPWERIARVYSENPARLLATEFGDENEDRVVFEADTGKLVSVRRHGRDLKPPPEESWK